MRAWALLLFAFWIGVCPTLWASPSAGAPSIANAPSMFFFAMDRDLDDDAAERVAENGDANVELEEESGAQSQPLMEEEDRHPANDVGPSSHRLWSRHWPALVTALRAPDGETPRLLRPPRA